MASKMKYVAGTLEAAGTAIKNNPKAATVTTTVGVGSIAMAAVAVPILGAVGFTAAGPAAGSAAAAWQSSIGIVQAGSLFSAFQGAAMGGAAASAIGAAAGGVGAAIGGAVGGVINLVRRR